MRKMAYEYGQMENCITLQGRKSHENTMRGREEPPQDLNFQQLPAINLTKLKAFHMGAAEIAIILKKYIRANTTWKHWSIPRAYQYECRSFYSFTKTTLSLLLIAIDSEGKSIFGLSLCELTWRNFAAMQKQNWYMGYQLRLGTFNSRGKIALS